MIAIIVAHDKNRVIGNKGNIPWKIPGEQKRFRQLTMGNAVIMGRKTYEEIGRPLPGRLNIVVSSTAQFSGENLKTACSLEQAISMAEGKDIFISGGRGLYARSVAIADVMYITEIDAEYEGDRFFPQFDESLWKKETVEVVHGSPSYRYLTYTKI